VVLDAVAKLTHKEDDDAKDTEDTEGHSAIDTTACTANAIGMAMPLLWAPA